MSHFEYLLLFFWFFGDPPESEPGTEEMIAENFRNLEEGKYRERLIRNRLSGFEFGRRWIKPIAAWLQGVRDSVRKK